MDNHCFRTLPNEKMKYNSELYLLSDQPTTFIHIRIRRIQGASHVQGMGNRGTFKCLSKSKVEDKWSPGKVGGPSIKKNRRGFREAKDRQWTIAPEKKKN